MRTGTDSCPGRVARVKTSAGLAEESETDRGSGLVVAVDGPSGAGKSSASRGAARALGLRYLDTGSMYRALTWWLLDRGADTTDPEVVARLAAELRPDVILMDLRMPRMDGVEATRRLRERDPDVKVVVLTTYADDRSVLDALRAGALGYLTKDAGAAEIQQALHRVAAAGMSVLHCGHSLVDGLASGLGSAYLMIMKTTRPMMTKSTSAPRR